MNSGLTCYFVWIELYWTMIFQEYSTKMCVYLVISIFSLRIALFLSLDNSACEQKKYGYSKRRISAKSEIIWNGEYL